MLHDEQQHSGGDAQSRHMPRQGRDARSGDCVGETMGSVVQGEAMSQILTCFECGRPTSDYYVDAKGQIACKACHEMLQARQDRNECCKRRETEKE